VAVRLRYLSFQQLVGRGVACWPMFEVDESASRQTRGSANRQQKYANDHDAVPDRDHLMVV
jgi:hypothetical protein